MSVSPCLLRYTSYAANGAFGVICQTSSQTGTYPLHRHDYIEVEYLARGRIAHELNGVSAALGPGDCYGLGLHDLHRFRVTEPVEFHNLCIHPGTVDPAVRALLASQPFPFCGHLPDEVRVQVDGWFAALSAQLRADDPYGAARVTAYLLLILTTIFARSHPVPAGADGARCVRQALDWIGAHYGEPISLKRMADAVHLSPCYFSTVFSAQVGCAFVPYLTRVRIEKARQRLISTDDAVTDIALDCGFGSFSSFSRAFRRYTGTSAQAFRASWR